MTVLLRWKVCHTERKWLLPNIYTDNTVIHSNSLKWCLVYLMKLTMSSWRSNLLIVLSVNARNQQNIPVHWLVKFLILIKCNLMPYWTCALINIFVWGVKDATMAFILEYFNRIFWLTFFIRSLHCIFWFRVKIWVGIFYPQLDFLWC